MKKLKKIPYLYWRFFLFLFCVAYTIYKVTNLEQNFPSLSDFLQKINKFYNFVHFRILVAICWSINESKFYSLKMRRRFSIAYRILENGTFLNSTIIIFFVNENHYHCKKLKKIGSFVGNEADSSASIEESLEISLNLKVKWMKINKDIQIFLFKVQNNL